MISTLNLIVTLIAGLGAWTISTVGLTLYLHNKFRGLEVLIYRELNKHRLEIERTLNQHSGRIQRLEIMVTGKTIVGPTLPPYTEV